MSSEGEIGAMPGRRLLGRWGILYRRRRGEEHALVLMGAAVRRSGTGMAILRGGRFLVRNARWLVLDGRPGAAWRGDGLAYAALGALAVGESSAMARAGARTRERRFARADPDEVIDLRLEQLDGRPAPLVLAMACDVTEAVRVERRRERARAEAAERERARAVSDLAAGVAHELNNALHAMALRIASLRGALGGGEGDQGLGALSRMVIEAADRVSRLQEHAAGPSGPAVTPVPLPAADVSPRAPLRILVVDDDPDVLEAAGLALEHLKQRVALAPSGRDAVARFAAGERFDVVLCDIAMPQLDGWQVARQVHALAPRTRIYLVSGCLRGARPGDPQREGVTGVFAKPLSLEALRGLLAAPAEPEAGLHSTAP